MKIAPNFLSPADILRQEDSTGFAVGDVIILGQDIAQGVAEGGAGDIDDKAAVEGGVIEPLPEGVGEMLPAVPFVHIQLDQAAAQDGDGPEGIAVRDLVAMGCEKYELEKMFKRA